MLKMEKKNPGNVQTEAMDNVEKESSGWIKYEFSIATQMTS